MMEAVARQDQIEATDIELWALYKVLRSSYLNVLYQGALAVKWSRWNLGLQVGASIGSLGAVGAFLAAGSEVAKGHEGEWKLFAALIGVVSAVCAALPAIIGHAGKINRFDRLHFAYSELFQLTQRLATDIRREGIATQEQIGTSKTLADIYSRLGHLDDPDLKTSLRDDCELKVREKYPDGSLWYASKDGHQRAERQAADQTAQTSSER